MSRNCIFYWLLLALGAGVLGGCNTPTQKQYGSTDGVMLGTRMHLVAELERASAQGVYAEAMTLDAEAKASMSIFDENSLLSRLNDNRTDSVDHHIAFNLHLADSIASLSGGYYDVTIKPLVEAWGFAGKRQEQHPNIDSILTFIGHEKVRIRAGRLEKSDPRVQLDFNSIAKGYTVDLLAQMMERRGAENYLVEVGGEVRTKGVNAQGKAWVIGIETPFDGNMSEGEYLQRRVTLSGASLATSGNYRRFYIDSEGRKVAHTLNPKTGYSTLSRLLSVTVVAPTCAEADALCTMLMAMGDKRALAFAERTPSLQAYFILSGEGEAYEEHITPAMQALMLNE